MIHFAWTIWLKLLKVPLPDPHERMELEITRSRQERVARQLGLEVELLRRHRETEKDG